MNNQQRADMIACVAEGVRQALVGLKLVEEVEHPVTKAMLPTKTLAEFREVGGLLTPHKRK